MTDISERQRKGRERARRTRLRRAARLRFLNDGVAYFTRCNEELRRVCEALEGGRVDDVMKGLGNLAKLGNEWDESRRL